MNGKLGWWFSVFIALAPLTAAAQESAYDPVDSFFHSGKCEASVLGGVMFSPVGADRHRPTVNYTLSGLQFGYMLTDAHEKSWYSGNVELLGEAFGGAVFDGKGSYIAGGTLWLRYNVVQRNLRLVPYLQGGVGAEGTDMNQDLIGQKFNFNLNVAAGVGWFVARDVSINAECLYQHISNAKLSSTDIGINAVGPVLGISYFF